MTYDTLKRTLTALLFAAGDPVETARLAEITQCSRPAVLAALDSLQEQWEQENSPLELLFLGESCQLVTRREFGPYIKELLLIRKNAKLSQAALEVLAVIAYNQPITRGFVEQVRGVDSSSIVTSLVEKGLVEERGRLDLPGRPIAYGTTENFLRCFGLGSLEELPPVRKDALPASEEA
ncbi:MAG: SMC-Scp complex subunit ScpB [Oscillospiraceae bacterium]|jgi:segregation and condensation protein B|nr:SMC-Scp complex subunit ScpB [Oscillospiraceae bacterium]